MIIHLYCCPLIQLFSQSQFDDHAMSSSSSSTLLRSSDYFYMNLKVADLVGAKNKQIGLKYVLNLEIRISSLLFIITQLLLTTCYITDSDELKIVNKNLKKKTMN